jgi:hypothetical protein
MINQFLLAVAAPVATALVGLFVVWLQEWRRGRDAFSQRTNARQEATELVTFYEKWIQTQKLVCSPEEYEAARQVVQDRLDRLAATLPEPEEVDPRPAFSLRQLLLLYHPASRAAWVAHVAFYVMFVLALLATFGSLMPEDDGTFAHWTEIVGASVIVVVLTLVLRTVAVAVDERDHRRYLAELRAKAPAPANAPAPPKRIGVPAAPRI